MVDKPDAPDATKVQADPEMAQLAAQIAGEPDPIIVEGKDSVSPQEGAASEGKDAKPEDKGDGTPASKGKAKTEDGGEEEPGEGEEEGEKEELFKDLEGALMADPKGALKILLEHPTLGPVLNRWSDRAGNAQVATALEEARPGIEADAKRSEAERAEDNYFSSMSEEEVTAAIGSDPKVASAYARYQQREQAGEAPNATAVVQASQIYSYASEVALIKGLLDESELSDEVKETLKPDNFRHLKVEGIAAWKKAVFQAIVTHEATSIAAKEIAAKKETLNEEIMADIDGERPAVTSGRREGPSPDLIKTDSGVLLENALSGKAKKGK